MPMGLALQRGRNIHLTGPSQNLRSGSIPSSSSRRLTSLPNHPFFFKPLPSTNKNTPPSHPFRCKLPSQTNLHPTTTSPIMVMDSRHLCTHTHIPLLDRQGHPNHPPFLHFSQLQPTQSSVLQLHQTVRRLPQVPTQPQHIWQPPHTR